MTFEEGQYSGKDTGFEIRRVRVQILSRFTCWEASHKLCGLSETHVPHL